MTDLFIQICNMSITAAYIIAVIVLIRLFAAKKLPKIVSYALWGIVLLRLAVPVSFPSAFSVFNLVNTPVPTVEGMMEYIPRDIGLAQTPQIDAGLPSVNEAVNASLPAATPMYSINPMQVLLFAAAWVWLAGMLLFLLCYAVSLLMLRSKLKTAVLYRDNVFLSDQIKGPIVFGFVKPRIILPSGIEGICTQTEIGYIIAHETVHIKRLDHIIKALSVIVLAVYWFNPFVWLAFILSDKDRELACDERVMKLAEGDIRADYAHSLVNIASREGGFLGSLAFGESNVKSRVKAIVNFKKPAVWITLAGIVIAVAACVVCLTNGAAAPVQAKVNQYLDTIVNERSISVAASSNPYDYINANSEAFYALVALGSDGRNAMLDLFEKSGDNGLREYIMAIACNAIEPIMIDDSIDSGRAWYEAYRNGGKPLDLLTPATDYTKVNIRLLTEFTGFKASDEFETEDIRIVAAVDSMMKSTMPYEGAFPDLKNNHVNQYAIELSSKDGGYACLLSYDTLYYKAYLERDGGIHTINPSAARYLDSLLEHRGVSTDMDRQAVKLFNRYGWTLDYKINTLNETIDTTAPLSDFDPNLYYFAYSNELSKDIGLDMNYHNLNVQVEIYRIREDMPPESNPNKNARGIVVKKGNEIIGAFISAGRHSAFSACSLKGNFFEQVTGMTLDEWLSDRVQRSKNDDAGIENDTPEQTIATYFLALNKRDPRWAQNCLSKKSMLGSLTENMIDSELYSEFVGLPLTAAGIYEAKYPLNNLKSAKLIKTEWLNTPKGSETMRTYRVTVDMQYVNDDILSSGEQVWDCMIIYESPRTGWKIVAFGH